MKRIAAVVAFAWLALSGMIASAQQGPPRGSSPGSIPPRSGPMQGWQDLLRDLQGSPDSRPRPNPPRDAPPQSPATTEIPPVRDPTQPSDQLRNAIDATRATPAANAPTAAPGVPQFTIKARLVGRMATPSAILAIDGGQLLNVRKGGEYQLPNGQLFSVVEISEAGIEIELISSKRRLILH
ncbi:MAG TPA: hypothetical protein VG713_20305 [Pirellulales bacterium]|nr:hypothetical protein [Pirellulales bacterium]